MAIRILTEDNYIVFQDTTEAAGTEIARHPKKLTRYLAVPDVVTPANDYIFLFDEDGGDISGDERLRRRTNILRTNLVNGDDGDSLFATMTDLNRYLSPNTGNFNGPGAGATIPATGVIYNTKLVLESLDQLTPYLNGNAIEIPPPLTNIELDNPQLDLGDLYFNILQPAIPTDPGTWLRFSSSSGFTNTFYSSSDNYGGFVRGRGQVSADEVNFQLGGSNSQHMFLQANAPTDIIRFDKTTFVGGDVSSVLQGFDTFSWNTGRYINGEADLFDLRGPWNFGWNIQDVRVSESSAGLILANRVAPDPFAVTYASGVMFRCQYTAEDDVPFITTTEDNITIDQGLRVEKCIVNDNGNPSALMVSGIIKGNIRCDWTGNTGNIAQNTQPGFYLLQGVGALSTGNDLTYEPITINFSLQGTSEWWTLAGGVATYIGTTPLSFDFPAKISISGGIGDTYDIGYEIDPFGPDPAFVAGNTLMTTAITTGGNTRSENQYLFYRRTFNQGDTIRLVHRFDAAANDDIILLENSVFSCELSSP